MERRKPKLKSNARVVVKERQERERSKDKQKGRARLASPPALPKKSASTPLISAAPTAVSGLLLQPLASVSRRGIVISTSSEYDTTDTDDDSEWASEDSGEPAPAAPPALPTAAVQSPQPQQPKVKASKAGHQTKAQAAAAAAAQEEARLREAAEKLERERDMFAKLPKRSYSNLNRVQSGLLSQLLKPDPNLFPPNHPYRESRSTVDVAQLARPPALAMQPIRPGMGKSAAAQVQMSPVIALAPAETSRAGGGYRPKGRPEEEEMEDTSEDENPDDTIQVSHSLAQLKLAALADPNRRRRSADHHQLQQQQQQKWGGPFQPQRQGAFPQMQQIQEYGHGHGHGGLTSVATAPIPLSHPYNLPAPAPPMTPRTTRRTMLQTELSESLRRNLLWERQVSRPNAPAGRRGAGGSTQQQQQSQQSQGSDDWEEKRRRAMARNRSWADDFHYSGW